jgi:hypothetical protein
MHLFAETYKHMNWVDVAQKCSMANLFGQGDESSISITSKGKTQHSKCVPVR